MRDILGIRVISDWVKFCGLLSPLKLAIIKVNTPIHAIFLLL